MDFIIYKTKIIQPYDTDLQLTLNTVNTNQFTGFYKLTIFLHVWSNLLLLNGDITHVGHFLKLYPYLLFGAGRISDLILPWFFSKESSS